MCCSTVWGLFPLLSSLLWHEPLRHLSHTQPFTPFPSSECPSKFHYIWSRLMDYLHPHRSWLTSSMWPFLRFVPYEFSFKSSVNVVYWAGFHIACTWKPLSAFFSSPDPPWTSKEYFTQTQKCSSSEIVKVYLLFFLLEWVILVLYI